MATGIQTGIRTGSAPLPTGKGPGGGGGLGKIMASWSALSMTVRITVIALLLLVVGGSVLFMAVTAANKPVPLYATNLSPSDVTEIGRRLNELGIEYHIETGKILVHPSERAKIVGTMLAYGLPHRQLSAPGEGGAMTPQTESEKKAKANIVLENELIDQIRQFEIVADAYVKIVRPDEESVMLGSGNKEAKASVQLALKPGQKPSKMQIEAIINLVAFSVDGLKPENVKITDRTGFVWNEGANIANAPGSDGGDGAYEDEKLAIKKAYERVYQSKIQDSLNKILGSENYTVTVDADIDFTQTKIETTQVGEPGGNNSVVSVVKKDVEKYNTDKDGKPVKPGSSQVGMPGGSTDQDVAYEKVKYEQKVDTGKVVKTAIIAPGVVNKVTANIAVNGKRDDTEKAKYAQIAAAAIGLNPSRGDLVSVVDVPFNMQAAPADGPPAGYWDGAGRDRVNPNAPPTWMIAAMVVPTMVLLGVLAVFLLKQRKVQAERSGLILQASTGTTTSDISDLLSDKIGRSTATSQTTKVNNTEQLEKLAKEKPTKVAELLKSTWLSDKER